MTLSHPGPEVWFYHLTQAPVTQILPKLLEKASQTAPCVLQCASEEEVNFWDDLLWTYQEDSFLAHGSAREGFAAYQSVWITAQDDNPAKAPLRFLLGGVSPLPFVSDRAYKRVALLFEQKNQDHLSQARHLWRVLTSESCSLFYWTLDETGQWVLKERKD